MSNDAASATAIPPNRPTSRPAPSSRPDRRGSVPGTVLAALVAISLLWVGAVALVATGGQLPSVPLPTAPSAPDNAHPAYLYFTITTSAATEYDTYYPANVSVPVNQPVVVTILCYDDGVNNVTAPYGQVIGTIGGSATFNFSDGAAPFTGTSLTNGNISHTFTIVYPGAASSLEVAAGTPLLSVPIPPSPNGDRRVDDHVHDGVHVHGASRLDVPRPVRSVLDADPRLHDRGPRGRLRPDERGNRADDGESPAARIPRPATDPPRRGPLPGGALPPSSSRPPSSPRSPDPPALEEIFEHAPVGIVTVDHEGRLTTINPAARTLFGSTDRMVGTSLLTLPTMQSSGLDHHLAATLRSGTVAHLPAFPYTSFSSGRALILDVDILPLRHDAGRGRSALLIFNDTTERAQEVERARLFYQSFLHSHEAMEVTDRNGIIVDVNPAFERVYGYPRSELVGQKPRIVRSGKTSPETYRGMWIALLDPSVGRWAGEIVNEDRAGREHPVFLTITALRSAAGEITHFIGVATDLSQQKDFERQVARADRLASLGQLSAGVAHELNTPLANIMLMAESLKRKAPNPWVASRADSITTQVEAAAADRRAVSWTSRGTTRRRSAPSTSSPP